jgi:predicted AAA+ superfamily ATPase
MSDLKVPAPVIDHEKEIKKQWKIYSERGGFPEPLLMDDAELRNQWLSDYKDALLERDLKDITQSRDIERIYAVFELLLEQVSSRYSLRNIADTLHTTAATIKSDIAALKRLLLLFEVGSFSTRLSKSIRKEKKIYPIDSSLLKLTNTVYDNAGPYLETEVATSLYKHIHYFSLGKTQKAQLTYYRDYEHREVDFLLSYIKNTFLIESKLNVKNFSTSINYLHENKISPFNGIIVTHDGPYVRIAEKQVTLPIHLFVAMLY